MKKKNEIPMKEMEIRLREFGLLPAMVLCARGREREGGSYEEREHHIGILIYTVYRVNIVAV